VPLFLVPCYDPCPPFMVFCCSTNVHQLYRCGFLPPCVQVHPNLKYCDMTFSLSSKLPPPCSPFFSTATKHQFIWLHPNWLESFNPPTTDGFPVACNLGFQKSASPLSFTFRATPPSTQHAPYYPNHFFFNFCASIFFSTKGHDRRHCK